MIAAPGTNKAVAQDGYPTRPVKFLVPYPSGGTNDVVSQIVGDKLQAKWGQPVIIENRSGGSGNIGAALVAQAEPDGYTLLVSSTPPLATNQSLYKQLSYKPEEFVPITNFGSVPNLVMVRRGLPVNSVSELIAHAEGESWQARVWQPGGRQYSPPYRQHVHDHDRHQHGACAVSRRDAGLQ